MKRLKKPCKRCKENFQPTGKYQKICDKCNKRSSNVPLAIEYWIAEFIQNLKKKTIVTMADLEVFNQKAMNLIVSIEDLRKSRNSWRKKYEELKTKT